MIKIKVSTKESSDVTQYVAREWTVKVYRSYRGGEFFTAEKGPIQFVVKEDDDEVTVTKFVNGESADVKRSHADHCGVGGTLYINDHKDPARCYAFFRNERIQSLIDYFQIPKLLFQKDSDTTIDEWTTTSPASEILTDGIVTDVDIDGIMGVLVDEAKFIYDAKTMILLIPQNYDLDYIESELSKRLS